MKIPRASRTFFALVLALPVIGCRSGPIEGWSSRARTMILTSGPTEIAISSSMVPGYWAKEADSGQEFFLYTRVRSYEKGSRVRVEGPFGPAFPAVFNDEAGVYMQEDLYQTHVLVVWKMARSDVQNSEGSPSREDADRAPRQ